MLKINIDPMPSSSYSGRVKQKPGRWTHTGVKQNWDILVIMLSGECKFSFPDLGLVRHMKKNEATIIRAGNYYKGSCDMECEYYFFHIPALTEVISEPEALSALKKADVIVNKPQHNCYIHEPSVRDCLFMDEVCDISGVMKKLSALLAKCDIERSKRDVNRALRFDICLCEILALISEESMRRLSSGTDYPPALDRILTYINEHYTEPITLESLSDHFGISKQYMIRLFRKHLGTTVTHFINDLKLSHAPELLTGTTLNVGEIAEYLGFSSSGYFSRLFKAKFSVSPTKFV